LTAPFFEAGKAAGSRWLPGGLAVSTVFATAGFAARLLGGVPVRNAAVFRAHLDPGNAGDG